ncbi:Holliday junction branch migration protein RuvA [Alkalihalobacillus hemicellulosilyticus]|uniref:Holliday junction branch migration protein RuvA n=1 Tax=Halalkalibacter hemicellulosilyticus TaxID=127886 RepID=UPI00054EB880|nr:Holliday junction branch migration protein RuvA [Halalkalibacter hemicellulosilyticus]
MIDYIRGPLVEIELSYIVIDHQGLGYQIYCPNPFQFQANEGETIQIYTYQYVREDVLRLYGFATKEERVLFEKLLNVSGIGPKGALAILASGEPENVIAAIEQEDEAFLVRFPGVGKKTARQMILDLKGKLEELTPNLTSNREVIERVSTSYSELEEALEALRALGYVEKELKKVRPHLENEELTTDGYIKRALQYMLKS